jgi:hypothetical protein
MSFDDASRCGKGVVNWCSDTKDPKVCILPVCVMCRGYNLWLVDLDSELPKSPF